MQGDCIYVQVWDDYLKKYMNRDNCYHTVSELYRKAGHIYNTVPKKWTNDEQNTFWLNLIQVVHYCIYNFTLVKLFYDVL